MKRFILWLHANPLINGLMVIILYLSIVVFHDEVTRLAILLRNAMGRQGYNTLLLVLSIVFFSVITFYLTRKLGRLKSVTGIYLFVTIVLIIITFRLLMTYYIEAIHFFEYMLLAMILFPLVRSYGATVVWITLLGIVDEIYQYIILTPFFLYLDFNDMIMNLLGAGLGMVAVQIILGGTSLSKKRIVLKSPEIITILIIAIFFTFLYLAGEFRWNPDPWANPWLVANRKALPDEFWTEIYKGHFLHIMDHIEGIIVMIGLFVFYYLLDYLIPGKSFQDR